MNKIYYFIILLNFNILITENYDVTVIGSVKFEDARSRLSIGFMESLKDDLNINFIPIKNHFFNLKNINPEIRKIILNKDKAPAKISILFSSPCIHCASFVPDSLIKFAYTPFETNRIPKSWIDYVNKNFDAILVPDTFLFKVYKKSGLELPIFLAPHGLYLEDFLKKPIKSDKNKVFAFGVTAGFWPHKNHETLIKAFLNKFENNNDVTLKIHGNSGDPKTLLNIKELVKDKKNIQLITKNLNQKELIDFMSSLDCYILISKGEGFSSTPREAIALGIPAIISNNSAHKTLAKLPYFIPIDSKIKEVSNFNIDLNEDCGYKFNIDQKDLENKLEEVYNNYYYYLEKANSGREWVKKYDYKNLKSEYLSLVKPKNVILGDSNIITEDYLMTDCKKLYDKYLS